MASMNHGLGRRRQSGRRDRTGGMAAQYLIDFLNLTGYVQVLDKLVSGGVTETYTYGLQRISENQLVGSTWTPSFYGYDGHGNVRFLTSTTGVLGNIYQFDAFGMPIASAGTTANAYLYSGERFDQNIGLYHLRARYYNQGTGRFETLDPVAGHNFEPATLHKYLYSGSDPINFIDPSGQDDIGEYDALVSQFKGSGLQAHHIIPRRFAGTLGAAYCTIAASSHPQLTWYSQICGGLFYRMVVRIQPHRYSQPLKRCIGDSRILPTLRMHALL